MAFLCPVRIRKTKKKQASRPLDAPIPGRITGSDSIDTLVRVGLEKEAGPRARMIVVHDFVPCVEDELEVKRGQYVHVLYQENDWLYVISDTGREGFIPYTYCVPIERSVDDFVKPKSIPKQKPVANGSSAVINANQQNHQSHTRSPQQSRPAPIGGGTNQNTSQPPPPPQSSNLSRASSKSLPDIAAACENTPKSQYNRNTAQNPQQNHQTKNRNDYRSQRSSSSHSSDRIPLQSSCVTNRTNNTTTTAQVHSSSNGDPQHEYYNVRPFHRHSYHYGVQTQDIAQRNQRQNDNQSKRTSSTQEQSQFRNNRTPSENSRSQQEQPQFRSNRTPSESSHTQQESSQFRHNRSGSSRSLASSTSVTSSKSLPNQMDRSRDSRRSCSSDRNNSRDYNYHRSSTLPTQGHDPRYSQGQNQSRSRSGERPSTEVFVKRAHGRFIVLFPYSPTQENDLTVSRGEFVTVLNKDDPDWFFVRRSDGQEGFVPSLYLCQAEGQNLERSSRSRQSSQSSSYHQQDVSTSVDPSINFSPTRSTKLVCLYDYRAQAPGDLSVSRGQWLYSDLDSQVDSEWLWVYSPASRKSGYIPRTYAKPPNFGLIGSGNMESGDMYFSP